MGSPDDPSGGLLIDALEGGRYADPAKPRAPYPAFPSAFPMPRDAPWSVSITADGSPTLAHAGGEAMHTSAGALAETCYVYGPLAGAIARGALPPRAAVVGLGLGYVEILVACACVANGGAALADRLRLESFEIDPILRDAFRAFLSGEPRAPELPGTADHRGAPKRPDAGHDRDFVDPLLRAHECILRACADLHGIDAEHARGFLTRCFLGGGLLLRGPLDPNDLLTLPDEGCGALFFDAYSESTSSALWNDSFLDALLDRAAPTCLFATYASRTHLKKRVRAKGFRLAPRRGFAGKRECTLAWRRDPTRVARSSGT